MAGLAFLPVYIYLASMLAQIPASILAMTSVALVLMAAHVAQAVCRIGAGSDPDSAPDSAPEAVADGLMLDATYPASSLV